MTDTTNLRDTIVPKSDQLNADDLIAGSMTVKIAGVKRGDAEQPVIVALEGQRPYKPCKSMRRVLISAWGDDGSKWVGRSLTVYNDPEVKFGGVKVGGIRISHLSDIPSDLVMSLTATRGKRAEYRVAKLTRSMYPVADFEKNLSVWAGVIASGKMTAEQVIAKASQKGDLTKEQQSRVIALTPVPVESDTAETVTTNSDEVF
jgi:hypothetical protein